jgi:hypothetical protein
MKFRFCIVTILVISLHCIVTNHVTAAPDQPENLEKILKNATYGSGCIFIAGDSTCCEILIYRKREKPNSYLYCIVRQHNGTVKVYTPDDIDGYSIDKERFIKHQSAGKNYFIQQVRTGRVDLYKRGAVPYDLNFLYYLKIPGERNLLVINPQSNEVTMSDSKDSRDSYMMIYRSMQTDDKFKNFVSAFLGDCEKVVNAVNSGFYTVYDLPAVVDEYNHCL